MNEDLHPHIAELVKKYGRDLAQVSPSPTLDARIEQLVAGSSGSLTTHPRRHWQRPFAWAAAACFAVVAISAGIVIGVRLERSRDAAPPERTATQQFSLAPADLAMWPTDSVALTIPAEYSPQGTLVAVNPHDKSTGKRYLIDVAVSNDGTMRIERILPMEAEDDGVTLQAQ